MKIHKGMSVLLASMLVGSMLVGCSDEFDSTEYLDEQGKEIIKKYENREKYNYIKVEELDYLNRYEDEYIMITGKVTSISEEGLACYELGFDFEENHTTEPIRVFVQKNMIDVKFKKGDTIKANSSLGLSGGAKGTPGAGSSTGAHLHFEVLESNVSVNPMRYDICSS